MIDFVAIPQLRLKALKKAKGRLEELTQLKIGFNDEVSIEGDDSLTIFRMKEVVKAFGRGFDLDTAINMLDDEWKLELIEIQDFFGKSRDRLITLKGRVIGKGGKTKMMIENLADVKLSVYGKTVGIVGQWDRVAIAKEAVEMLLSGSMHSTIYRFLERHRR